MGKTCTAFLSRPDFAHLYLRRQDYVQNLFRELIGEDRDSEIHLSDSDRAMILSLILKNMDHVRHLNIYKTLVMPSLSSNMSIQDRVLLKAILEKWVNVATLSSPQLQDVVQLLESNDSFTWNISSKTYESASVTPFFGKLKDSRFAGKNIARETGGVPLKKRSRPGTIEVDIYNKSPMKHQAPSSSSPSSSSSAVRGSSWQPSKASSSATQMGVEQSDTLPTAVAMAGAVSGENALKEKVTSASSTLNNDADCMKAFARVCATCDAAYQQWVSSGSSGLGAKPCAAVHSALLDTCLFAWPSPSVPRGRPRHGAALLARLRLWQLSEEQLSALVAHISRNPRDDILPRLCVPALLCSACFLLRLRSARSSASRMVVKAIQMLCQISPCVTIPFLLARIARPPLILPWLDADVLRDGIGVHNVLDVGAPCRELLQRASRQAVAPAELSEYLNLVCADDFARTASALLQETEDAPADFSLATTRFLLTLEGLISTVTASGSTRTSTNAKGPSTSAPRARELDRLMEHWAAAESAAAPEERDAIESSFAWGVEMMRVAGALLTAIPKDSLTEESLRTLVWRLDASLPATGTREGVKLGSAAAQVVHSLVSRFPRQLLPVASAARSVLSRCQCPLARKTAALIDERATAAGAGDGLR